MKKRDQQKQERLVLYGPVGFRKRLKDALTPIYTLWDQDDRPHADFFQYEPDMQGYPPHRRRPNGNKELVKLILDHLKDD